jgi:putative DNA primase/helicase
MILAAARAARVEHEIARRGGLGLKRSGHELIGACPRCAGHDRFAVSISKQCFGCRGCGAADDVIALTMHVDGCGFRAAVRTLGGFDDVKLVVPVKSAPPPAAHDDTKQIERALSIWDEAEPIAGTVAAEYLRRRGLEPPESDEALRFIWACPIGDTRYPCLVALFRDIQTNEPKAIHRIAIGPGGILIGKRMLGPVGGCAVKIDADENVEYGLTVGEGLETCLAARQLGFRPVWSLGSASAIRAFPVLSGIEALTVLVDNDEPDRNGRQAGQEAAAECARRWVEAGREVRRLVPRKAGTDFNDCLAVEVRHD